MNPIARLLHGTINIVSSALWLAVATVLFFAMLAFVFNSPAVRQIAVWLGYFAIFSLLAALAVIIYVLVETRISLRKEEQKAKIEDARQQFISNSSQRIAMLNSPPIRESQRRLPKSSTPPRQSAFQTIQPVKSNPPKTRASTPKEDGQIRFILSHEGEFLRPTGGNDLFTYTEAWLLAFRLYDDAEIPVALARRIAGKSAIQYHTKRGNISTQNEAVKLTDAGRRHFGARPNISPAAVAVWVEFFLHGTGQRAALAMGRIDKVSLTRE
jgi:hypothetical protein